MSKEAIKQLDALIQKYSDKLYGSAGPHDAAKFEEDCKVLKQALAEQPAPVQPGRNHYEDGDVFERIAAMKTQPAKPDSAARMPCGASVSNVYDAYEAGKRAALAEQPAQQKPVAWMDASGDIYKHELWPDWNPPHTPLYTSIPAQQEPVAFITPLMEQQMFDDWCPYKGNPDPRVVWAAAVDAVNGLLLGATPQPAQQQTWKQGGLVTLNQDPYPSLGEWFVQFWEGDDVAARVYGNDRETLNRRCAMLSTPQPPAQRNPIPYNKADMMDLDINQRLAFKLGWKSAEEAHGIKENT